MFCELYAIRPPGGPGQPFNMVKISEHNSIADGKQAMNARRHTAPVSDEWKHSLYSGSGRLITTTYNGGNSPAKK